MMPSWSLREWQGSRAAVLAAYEAECVAMLSRQPPDPALAETIIRGGVVLLSANFQGYCRDLYTECALAVLASVIPGPVQAMFIRQCMARRELDGSNARYENVRSDFERFGLDLPTELKARAPLIAAIVTDLGHLNQWRNHVAHDNPTPPAHGGPLTLAVVQAWRASCETFAVTLDAVMYDHLKVLMGNAPW